MKKIASIIKYVLLIVSALSVIGAFALGESGVDFMLIWSGILMTLSVVTVLGLSLFNLVENPQGARRSLVGVGVVAVVLLIAYLASSTETIVTPVDTFDNKAELIISDMGIIATYIALAGLLLVVVAGEIRNSLK